MSTPETVALDFLNIAFANTQGYLTLTAFPADRHQPVPSRHLPLENPQSWAVALRDLLHANALGWHAVFSVATRHANLGRWRRGSMADLQHLPMLFVDIDQSPQLVLPRLQSYQPPPSAIVLSGGGVHAYWWLTHPTDDWARTQATLNHLQYQLNADHTTPAGAMRLPGSINPKPHRHGTRATVHTLTDVRYPLNAFPVAIPRKAVPPRTMPTTTPSTLNPRLVLAVTQQLLDSGGYWQRNGWLAARCPLPHQHDRPGAHFAFNPDKGVGMCFGKHGRLLLTDICTALHIQPNDYGGIYDRPHHFDTHLSHRRT